METTFARNLSFVEECRLIDAWTLASVEAGFKGIPKPDLLEMRIARSKVQPSSELFSGLLESHPNG